MVSPKDVRSLGWDPGYHKEFRKSPENKIHIWKVPEWFREVPDGPGEFRKCSGRYWKVLEVCGSFQKVWMVPERDGTFQKVPHMGHTCPLGLPWGQRPMWWGGRPRSWTPTRVPLGGTLEGLLLQGLAGHLYKGGQGCTLEDTRKSLRQP